MSDFVDRQPLSPLTNEQRRRAALAVCDLTGSAVAAAAPLVMLGLAERGARGLVAVGDENGISWRVQQALPSRP